MSQQAAQLVLLVICVEGAVFSVPALTSVEFVGITIADGIIRGPGKSYYSDVSPVTLADQGRLPAGTAGRNHLETMDR